jgi:hypothetical protein
MQLNHSLIACSLSIQEVIAIGEIFDTFYPIQKDLLTREQSEIYNKIKEFSKSCRNFDT